MQLSASEVFRIYPTPPSVENNEGEKFEEVKATRAEGSDRLMSSFLLENVSVLYLCLPTCNAK